MALPGHPGTLAGWAARLRGASRPGCPAVAGTAWLPGEAAGEGRQARCGLGTGHGAAAGAEHAFPGDQAALGDAAYNRGLYRDAAQLLKNATAHGDPEAGIDLIGLLHGLHPTDWRPAQWVAAHVALDNSVMVWPKLRAAGAQDKAIALLRRDPAAHAPLHDPPAVPDLPDSLREAVAQDQAAALASRLPGTGMFWVFLKQESHPDRSG